MASYRSDARLWALLIDEFHAAGADRAAAEVPARRAVAVLRRERTSSEVSTFAPGERIPLTVERVYDLDGDVWRRLATDPDSNPRDSWRRPGFDAGRHEGATGGVWLTPFLLESHGPLTGLPPARSR
jgi:hypothetical protein